MLKEERKTITYKEFEKEIEELGFSVTFGNDIVFVGLVFAGHLALISQTEKYNFKVYVERFSDINPGKDLGKMFYLAHLLSQTPLEDRVEQEEYMWKFTAENYIGSRVLRDLGVESWSLLSYNPVEKIPNIDECFITEKRFKELIQENLRDHFEKEIV